MLKHCVPLVRVECLGAEVHAQARSLAVLYAFDGFLSRQVSGSIGIDKRYHAQFQWKI